ncbi:MAG TPA: L-histidine N(alpha)-methyltransferase [Myxococcales bacterium]|nr:L-histidine N(alpha)-methyltransferase [Myxococcales bacterium]
MTPRRRFRNVADSPRTRAIRLVQMAPQSEALLELRNGLGRNPPEIPCKYFYDDRGSALFEQITALPEYYPTRTEHALLRAQARRIVETAGGPGLREIVELGSGAAAKTVALLDAALRVGGRPRYAAVDISPHALARTREIISKAHPEIPVVGIQADYGAAFHLGPATGPRLALFLGGTIGNYEDEGAVELLSRVRGQLSPGDFLLLGASLVTDPAAIHAAYNDAQRVTEAFNKNILLAVNAVAKSAFDPDDFHHHAPYVVERRRIEMWLVAKRPLDIPLGRIGGSLFVLEGDGIRTEISRRFSRSGVLRLLDDSGFTPERWFESSDGRFGLGLGQARETVRSL